ncbi:hypothetical protein EJ02DRAFT_439077 [Clathrospora elynae]|uniref:Uncharacterized protein n=1 Tax=Clathrospora elynae TaxID=706981 RepID=A0A6A5SB74_9PLEO|nr:hypothetical protein EJ02DRAFT_439077 [Clathrospora elynae]
MVTTRGGTQTPGTTPRSSNRKRQAKRELDTLETPTQVKRQRKVAPAPTPTPKKKAAEDVSDTSIVAVPSAEDPKTPAKEGLLPIRRRSSPMVLVAKISPPASTTTESFGESNRDETVTPSEDTVFHTPMAHSDSVYATPATHKRREAPSPTPKAKTMKDQTPASSSVKKGRGRSRKTRNDEPSALEVSKMTSTSDDEIPSSTFESETAPILSSGSEETQKHAETSHTAHSVSAHEEITREVSHDPSPSSSQHSAPPSAQPQKEHMRFGSEEPTASTKAHDSPSANRQSNSRYDVPPSAQKEPAHPQDSDDASDSDDEAPEVVTAATAASKAALSRADADRATKAQEAKAQAKRQAREKLIAAQQTAKREREEKKARKLAKKAVREEELAVSSDDDDVETEKRADMDVDMHGLLPTSLLETITDQRPPTPPPQRRGKTDEELRKEKLNHHIKFLERTEKGVKDVKKGKLSVAVLGQLNKVLPPKVNRQTKNVREHWLKGRNVEKRKGGKPNFKFGKIERRGRVGGGGFMRGGDE